MPPPPLRVEGSAAARAKPGMDPLGGGIARAARGPAAAAGRGPEAYRVSLKIRKNPEKNSKSSGTSGVVGVT